ncbi:hypothetical protein FDP41_010101 [Naegleria fowleri]|uniref:Histidine kinase n=1 Tax=Naegleria fowleri TaxID=5763 RepID=A0A6A5BD30_NAEFO|nr:uncharacterized protein FDP41_010101 [Naegleria fowleri]KAF0971878.1 hypothetical protein FDP41_010101 [Naegleria fowleri]CAG4718544.1 unnamed protein product [Naegleria fowleri]
MNRSHPKSSLSSQSPSEMKSPPVKTNTSNNNTLSTSSGSVLTTVSPSHPHFASTQRRASISFPSFHPKDSTSSPSPSSSSFLSSCSSSSDLHNIPDEILLTHLLKQGKNHSKIGAMLSVIPILFISLCCCEGKGCLVFLAIALFEIFLQIAINEIRKETLQSFIRWQFTKLVLVLMAQIPLQLYYGCMFPMYLLTTFKILIVSKNFCFNIRLLIFAGLFLVLGTSASMFIAYFIQSFLQSALSEKTWLYPLNPTSLNQLRNSVLIRLIEIFVLQISVMLGGYLFSESLIQTNQEYTRQQVEITREKVKNFEKTKFIANLSHEARNPIHCILGSLQVLSHHFHAEKCSHGCEHCLLNNSAIAETMQDIKENATLLLHILSSSLQLTSLEMDKIVLKNEEFSLINLTDSLVGAFSHLAQEKRISLNAFCNAIKVPPLLKGDSVRISQILMNIVSNAIKYTKKGFVRVNCDVLKEDSQELQEISSNLLMNVPKNKNMVFVKIECIDTGCGITQSQMQNIFQPYRIIPTDNEEETSFGFEHYFKNNRSILKLDDGGSSVIHTKRTGLGLSISKMLVSKMHGIISVESCPHQGGTVFTIILPLEMVTEEQEGSKKIHSDSSGSPHNDLLLNRMEHYDEKGQLSTPIEQRDRPLCNIFIIDPDYCFKEVLKDYLALLKPTFPYVAIKEFNDLKSFQTELKSGSLPSVLDSTITSMVFIDENEYDTARKCQFFQMDECHLQIIPTRFRGSMKQFSTNVRCLSKPLRYSDLLEIFQHADHMFRHFHTSNDDSFLHHQRLEKSPSLDLTVSSLSSSLDQSPQVQTRLNVHHFVTTPAENGHPSVVQAPTNSPLFSPSIEIASGHHLLTNINHNNTCHPQFPCVPTNPDFSKFSVLIADDNAVNRKVLVKMLQIIGFQNIDVSNDGKECFEKYQQKSYDLVLLDCIMPVLSGKEACTLIRKCEEGHSTRIPIVAITANTWEVRETLLSQGFDDVLYKPLVLETFRQVLVKLLSQRTFLPHMNK